VTDHDLVIAGAVGLLSAFFGIALMRGVPLCEAAFKHFKVPTVLRPALGGGVVGALALISPQVMSSGHGALQVSGLLDAALPAVALVLALKAVASVISRGSGFGGGFFFSLCFLGALGGGGNSLQSRCRRHGPASSSIRTSMR